VCIWSSLSRDEPILLFFSLVFLFGNSVSIIYFAEHLLYLLRSLKYSNTCDCSVRVFHIMVTALLGYLDLLVIFQGA